MLGDTRLGHPRPVTQNGDVMSEAGWLKRRLTHGPAGDGAVSDESSASPPVGDTSDVEQSQVADLVDQDPESVPNRVEAPPPPTTEEAGIQDDR